MSYKIGARRTEDITSGTFANARISTGSVSQHVGDLALDDIGNPDAARAMNDQKITGLADPTAAQDAATKTYVDSLVQGLSPKESVRCAATSDVAMVDTSTTILTASANGALSIDGVTPSVGDRVLLTAQDDEANGDLQNGVFTVTTVGNGSTKAVITRATDFDTLADINGSYFFVEEGTSNAHSGYLVHLPDDEDSFTLGTTAIKIVKFTGATATVNNSDWSGTDLAVGNGGTAASTASGARTNLGLAIGSNVQAYDADLDNLSGCQSGGSAALAALTSTEIGILDGCTATTAELNILDGVTSTAAELNILDGVTSTAAELNIMDGDTSATSTTIVDADRVVLNDNGTMVQAAMSDVKTYIGSAYQAVDADLTNLAGCQSGASAALAALTSTEVEILDGCTATTAELNILDGVTSTAAELNILDGVTSTAAELNILDGVTSTAAELNILDGVTSTAAELNIMDGDTSATSTTIVAADRVVLNDNGTMVQVSMTDMGTYFGNGFQAKDADLTNLASCQSGASAALAALTSTEVEILDGCTATTAELNILDGVTSTAAELNILDGVTSTAAELNILDGVTSTTAELNIMDGVTATTAELNIMDGVTATTAELNIMDGTTSTATELNLLDYSAVHNGDESGSKVLAISKDGGSWAIRWKDKDYLSGPVYWDNIKTVTSGTSYEMDSDSSKEWDHIIALDMTAIDDAFTVDLLTTQTQGGNSIAPYTMQEGRRIVVKDTTGGCASDHTITLDAGSGNTIDGSRTYVVTAAYASITLVVTTAVSSGTTGYKWSVV